jgi:hypothetical protein
VKRRLISDSRRNPRAPMIFNARNGVYLAQDGGVG